MARRYGRLPSELAQIDISDFIFNGLVANEGILSDERAAAKFKKKLKKGKK